MHDWTPSTGLIDVTMQREVAIITLSRPDKLNALTLSMRRDLAAALRHFGDGTRARGLVLTGRGRAFSAGEDLTSVTDPDDESGVTTAIESFHDLTRATLSTKVPTIAAVNGLAVGGASELTLCFDSRVGSPAAEFFLPENHLGLVISNAASLLLTRLLGTSQATRLVLESSRINAAEAAQHGLLDDIIDDGLVDHAIDRIHTWSPSGSATAAHLGLLRPALADVEAAMAHETHIAQQVWKAGTSQAGIQAFWQRKTKTQTGQ